MSSDEEQGPPYPPTPYERCAALGAQLEHGLLQMFERGAFTLLQLEQVVEGVRVRLQEMRAKKGVNGHGR